MMEGRIFIPALAIFKGLNVASFSASPTNIISDPRGAAAVLTEAVKEVPAHSKTETTSCCVHILESISV